MNNDYCLKMKRHDATGKLITFCGLDGCGKSSLINLLLDYLKSHNHNYLLTKQPTESFRKNKIFRNFQDSDNHDGYDYRGMSLLAVADRFQHSCNIIVPNLLNGNVVVSDRYFYSCFANLKARGYGADLWIYEMASHVIEPDIAFFLDVPVKVAIDRVRSRPEEKDRYIDHDLQYKLREEYLKIAKANDGVIINTEGDINDSFSKVIQHLEHRINIKS